MGTRAQRGGEGAHQPVERLRTPVLADHHTEALGRAKLCESRQTDYDIVGVPVADIRIGTSTSVSMGIRFRYFVVPVCMRAPNAVACRPSRLFAPAGDARGQCDRRSVGPRKPEFAKACTPIGGPLRAVHPNGGSAPRSAGIRQSATSAIATAPGLRPVFPAACATWAIAESEMTGRAEKPTRGSCARTTAGVRAVSRS